MLKSLLIFSSITVISINFNLISYSHPGHSGHENWEERQNPNERLINVQDLHWKIETKNPEFIKLTVLDKNFKPISLDKAKANAIIKTRKYKKDINLTSTDEYLKGDINLSDQKNYKVIVKLDLEGKIYNGTFIF